MIFGAHLLLCSTEAEADRAFMCDDLEATMKSMETKLEALSGSA